MPLLIEFRHRYARIIQIAPEAARAKKAIHCILMPCGAQSECQIDCEALDPAHVERLHDLDDSHSLKITHAPTACQSY